MPAKHRPEWQVNDVVAHRVGLIVPSSNVTIESEIPALLARSGAADFSFHGARMRTRGISARELAAMNAQREICVLEIGDAGVDVIFYAGMSAVMASGTGDHRRVESLVAEQLATGGLETKVRSSAGALLEALEALGARRIAVVTPYVQPIEAKIIAYLEAEGFVVSDHRALGIERSSAVAGISGQQIMSAARELDLQGVDALVLSASDQMPSLDLIADAEAEFGIPVISGVTSGVYSLLRALGLPMNVPDAGRLLQLDLADDSTSAGVTTRSKF